VRGTVPLAPVLADGLHTTYIHNTFITTFVYILFCK
jgi:hypothetical protein